MRKELNAKVAYETKVSKAGNEYSVLEIRFKNGYSITFFPSNDQNFILKSFILEDEKE